jgi:hypothetical protein
MTFTVNNLVCRYNVDAGGIVIFASRRGSKPPLRLRTKSGFHRRVHFHLNTGSNQLDRGVWVVSQRGDFNHFPACGNELDVKIVNKICCDGSFPAIALGFEAT